MISKPYFKDDNSEYSNTLFKWTQKFLENQNSVLRPILQKITQLCFITSQIVTYEQAFDFEYRQEMIQYIYRIVNEELTALDEEKEREYIHPIELFSEFKLEKRMKFPSFL